MYTVYTNFFGPSLFSWSCGLTDAFPSCLRYFSLLHWYYDPPRSIHLCFFLPQALSLSLSHTRTHAHTHARTHTHTHTASRGMGTFFPHIVSSIFRLSLTHTHTHSLSLSLSLSLSCSVSQKQRGQWSCLSLDTTTGMSSDRVCHITHVQFTTTSVNRQVGSSLFWVSWCSTNHQSNISVHSNSGNEQSCIVQ